jgi:thioesterase domain-containing protein/acyl carrier protein
MMPSTNEHTTALAGPAKNGSGIKATLITIFEQVLQQSPIGEDDDFFDLGGDSVQGINLMLEIEKVTGRALPVTALYDAPSVARIAALLTKPSSPTQPPCLVVLKYTGGSKPPLFLIHDVTGDVLIFGDLARRLPNDRSIYGLRARGLENGEAPVADIEEMARDYLTQIRTVQPEGPYFLGGFSLGGIIAHEMANILRGQGHGIGWLGLFDTMVLRHQLAPVDRLAHDYARIVRKLRALRRLPPSEQRTSPARLFQHLVQHRSRDTTVYANLSAYAGNPAIVANMSRIRAAGIRAALTFRPRRFPGEISFFFAQVRDISTAIDPTPYWRRYAGTMKIFAIPAGHVGMLRPPAVEMLAEQVCASLANGAKPGSQASSDHDENET